MYEFPIKYFQNNLIFNKEKNECWAAYKMVGYNYDFKSEQGKIDILNYMSRFIANIGKEAMICIIPVAQNVKAHYINLTDKLNKEDIFYRQAKAHAAGTEAYLEEKLELKGNANDYKIYVITKLTIKDNILEELKDFFYYLIKDPAASIEEFMGVGYKEIYEKDILMFKKLANEYFRKQRRRVQIEFCNSGDVEWLIRRPFFRGLKDSFKLRSTPEKNWTPFVDTIIKNGEEVIECDETEVLQLTEGIIDPTEKKCIKIEHDSGTSYQTFLSMAYIPDGILFPGNEWLLALQDYPVTTETIIKITTTEHKDAIKNVSKKKKEIKDQIEHIYQSDAQDELPDELYDSRGYANELEAELKASRSPITEASITFCLYADNKEELEAKVEFIKEIYTDNNFILERSLTDQLKLFLESIPGTPRYVKDYIKRLPPRTLAGSGIGATRMLGDNIGPYIGTTGVLKKNVYLDISRATKLNSSASAGFYGTLGGGKSFGANLLFYLSVLYGAYGLVIDPKGERSNWIKDLPELQDQINIITLSSDEEDKGKLDPFIIYKDDVELAASLAISMLSELFNINSKDDEYIAILEAIELVKSQENRSMTLLADILLNMDQDDDLGLSGKKLGRKIKLLRNMAMAGLLFGEGGEEGLDFKKRVNIIQIQNLNMPKPDTPKEEYTQEEVLSTVLMLPIASFARKFMHQTRRFFKIVEFDEAWALESNSAGKQMMNALIREGRALNAGCLFISQSTKDVKEEAVKTNISYKFCFKAREIEEIKSVLEFLDLEVTQENIDQVKNLENGECLFQDLDGRVGILKFDAVFTHLIDKAFNTNPQKVNEEGE